MKNSKKEKEINLWDALCHVLLHWRSILGMAFVFAVLFGALGYIKSAQSVRAQKATYDTVTLENYSIQPVAKHRATTYMAYEKAVEKQSDYNLNASIMKLNPNDFCAGELLFYVEASEDIQDAICQSYLSSVLNDTLAERLITAFGKSQEEKPYIMELVGTDGRFLQFDSKNAPEKSLEPSGKGVIRIYVYGENEQVCQNAMQVIDEEMSAVHNELKQYDHTLKPIGSSCVRTSSGELLMYQNDNIKKAQEYLVDFNNIKREMSGVEEQYIALYKRQAEGAEKETPMFGKPTVQAKYVMVGFVLGAILVLVLHGVLYIFSGVLRLEDDIEEQYSLSCLGQVILTSNQKKKWFAFVDGMFVKLRHMNKHYFGEEDCVSMIASNLKVWAQKKDCHRIYVTGTWMDDMPRAVAEKIDAKLKGTDIQFVIGEAVISHAQAFEDAAQAGSVLFVEQTGKTLHRELQEEILMCQKNEVEIIGIVTVTEGESYV